ncbi:hypothetical protein ES705_50295 [subsurface metagenome]
MATEDDLVDKNYYVVTVKSNGNKDQLQILKKLNKKENVTILFVLPEPATLENMIESAKKSLGGN